MAKIEVHIDEELVVQKIDMRLMAMNEALKQENAELKRLLGLAINDLEFIGSCASCENENNEDDPHCAKGCFYEWQYAAESEKLLDGGVNDGSN